MNRNSERLALLVGSNPLPNFLAAKVLNPKEVVLLYSPETEDFKNYLSSVFKENGIQVTDRCINDATDARCIRDVCNGLDYDHLHYSGGTKPMAAHARKAFTKGAAHASYLDERNGSLRFDDEYSVKLDQTDLGLTLGTLFKLHGIESKPPSASVPDGPTSQDMCTLAHRVLRDPSVAQHLYDRLRPHDKEISFSKAKDHPLAAGDFGLHLSAVTIPDTDWTRSRYEAFEKFLTGGWLEWWSAEMIHACSADCAPEIRTGLYCTRPKIGGKRTFEIDVALIRGHRLYVASCTTADKMNLCKHKLFEVAMRSRQMGGDLARCALVCLLDGGDTKGLYAEQLQSDIKSVWEAPNVPQVFGLSDLREWAGINTTQNAERLKRWLSE